MAKFSGKNIKRRAALGLSAVLAASLSLGIFAACTDGSANNTTEDEEQTSSQTDTQKIRNGNFEFYDEMDTELKEKRDFIASPSNWTFSSGSPSSDTSSGIVDFSEWSQLSAAGGGYLGGLTYEFSGDNADEDRAAYFNSVLSSVVSHWEDDNVTVYDRLRFYSVFEEEIEDLSSSSEAAQLFEDWQYSIDFEDVEYFRGSFEEAPAVHEGAKEGETAVLMIHNHRTSASDDVVGTGQHYSSGTTVTLASGTSAKLTLWVRTDDLAYGSEDSGVSPRASAYIEVAQTVGGTSLDEWSIENIQTESAWQQYTLYLRANSYAETTFTVTLGLGRSTSDDRYEAVNGYAFFDDLNCTVISNGDYTAAAAGADKTCTLNNKGDEKTFDDSEIEKTAATAAAAYGRTFALDLYTDFDALTDLNTSNQTTTTGLTKDPDNEKYESKIKAGASDKTGVFTYSALNADSSTNRYLNGILQKDFQKDGVAAFPFNGTGGDSLQTILLMSVSGAAYTAKLESTGDVFTLQPDEYKLVSFWAKTSAIQSGATGASVTLVDGENRTQIEAFDTTTADTVDIENPQDKENDQKDIYNGWVQCFFFVANETDTAKTFSLEFHYGPAPEEVASAELSAYADGYAAFTDFRTAALSKTQYGYAADGDYAKKVSLTGAADNSTKFDDASAAGNDWNESGKIEEGLALPASFKGVLAGSNALKENGTENAVPADVYTGMLNAKYAGDYLTNASSEAWLTALKTVTGTTSAPTDPDEWWNTVFGNAATAEDNIRSAYQPLAIYNGGSNAAPSYGFYAASQTVSANTAQQISIRVKLSAGATATVYLIDTSDPREGYRDRLTPTLPSVTYWYDDEGNITRGDPSAKDFNAREDTLYYLAENGLYYKAGTSPNDANVTYYANLHNYDREEDTQHYITKDGTIAFYYNEADKKTYAYRTEKSLNTYEYSQPVENLPLTDDEGASIVRYTAPTDLTPYETAITVTGTAHGWTEVTFYVQTGSAEKNFRLEVWAGSRDNETNGIPANGYVFFDDYRSESVDNYEELLTDAEETLKGTDANLDPTDDTRLNDDLALYYTYTFYDATDFLRYDMNEDEDGLGNPYGSYKQSEQTETIAWLKNGTSVFYNYGATDVTVEADDLGGDDTTTEDEDTGSDPTTNIWLIVSSSILAFVLLAVVVMVLVRRLLKNRKKHTKIKPVKEKKKKKAKPSAPASSETPEEPKDENDPYNE